GLKEFNHNNQMYDIYESVERHHQGVDRHHTGNRPMTLGLQPAFYTLVSQHPFHGLPHEQPMDHIERFEDLVSIIKARVVSEDYLLRMLFPYSLAGEAASWLKELIPGSLTTWQQTKMAFLRNFTKNYGSSSYQALPPPTSVSKIESMLEQIQESLQRTLERFPRIENNLTTTCHAVLMEDEDEFVEIEENDVDLLVAEADDSTHNISVDQHHLGVDRHSSDTEAESTFDGAESRELDTKESMPDSSPKKSEQEIREHQCRWKLEWLFSALPFDDHCKLEVPLQRYVKKMITNGVSAEDLSLLTKDISAILVYEDPEKKPNKRQTVAISELVSAMIQCRIPEKLPDPGSFVLDCSISTGRFPHSLYDLGSCINLMPHSVAVKLGMTDFRPTKIALLLADRSKRIPEGVLEDVLVQIGECLIPTDFVVLEYEEEPPDALILGRSFIATAGAQIDVKQGRISLHVCDVVMNFDMDKLRKPPTIDGQAFYVETSTDITAGYVKELDSVEEVTLKAAKLEDWSGDHLFNTRLQDEVHISDKLLQDDVFLMETQIAEFGCRISAEIRAADSVSVDTRLDETVNFRPHLLAVDTKSRHNALVSIDTTTSVKTVVMSTTAPLLLHPPPEQLRYSRSPPKPPDFINKTFKIFKTVSRLSKPRVSRRALVRSFDDCACKRSIPPIPKSHRAVFPHFLGQPHAPTAYTPPWLIRRFSRKYLLPPSDPPDARIPT
ncbi:hypothetical protein ISN44_Un133g000010, partial [Arabidopsis suecica]